VSPAAQRGAGRRWWDESRTTKAGAGQLDHLGLLFLFAIFFAADAGRVWGLDTLRRRKRKPG
jgi:hypothetical protein